MQCCSTRRVEYIMAGCAQFHDLARYSLSNSSNSFLADVFVVELKCSFVSALVP